MKKKILTLGTVLVMVAVLVLPTAVLAQGDGATNVGGDVVQGFIFSAPTGVVFGDRNPNATPSLDYTTGWLQGNSITGYNVVGVDAKTTSKGYMVATGPTVLSNMLLFGPISPTTTADTSTNFLATGGITNELVPFYVSQTVEFTDPVANNYSITIEFTVTQGT